MSYDSIMQMRFFSPIFLYFSLLSLFYIHSPLRRPGNIDYLGRFLSFLKWNPPPEKKEMPTPRFETLSSLSIDRLSTTKLPEQLIIPGQLKWNIYFCNTFMQRIRLFFASGFWSNGNTVTCNAIGQWFKPSSGVLFKKENFSEITAPTWNLRSTLNLEHREIPSLPK